MNDAEKSCAESAITLKRSRPNQSESPPANKVTPTNKRSKLGSCKLNEIKFRHGNYNRYYGYRNSNREQDKRIVALDRTWFQGKSCLDVGCNVGHLTLWIAKNFEVSHMKGVDIDCELIKAAKSNIENYLDDDHDNDVNENDVIGKKKHLNGIDSSSVVAKESPLESTSVSDGDTFVDKDTKDDVIENRKHVNGTDLNSSVIKETGSRQQPHRLGFTTCEPNDSNTETGGRSFQASDVNTGTPIGAVESKNADRDISGLNTTEIHRTDVSRISGNDSTDSITKTVCGHGEIEKTSNQQFPYNVTFVTENFVPASSKLLEYVKPRYDVIMCLSVTKWIQLNSGDDGLKLVFQKIHKSLNVGGLFLLEPQPFKSYKRKKNLTTEIRQNYDNITLFPEQYVNYLLSDEVGFKTAQQIDITRHEKEGFQRPIFLLRK